MVGDLVTVEADAAEGIDLEVAVEPPVAVADWIEAPLVVIAQRPTARIGLGRDPSHGLDERLPSERLQSLDRAVSTLTIGVPISP